MSMLVSPAPITATPLALVKPGNPRVAAAAAQFGAASPQLIQVITDKVLALAGEAANASVADAEYNKRAQGERPALRRPELARLQQNAAQQAGAAGAGGRLTPEAALTLFMSQLSTLLSAENNEQLKTQLQLVQSRLQARASAGEAVSEALRQAQGAVEAALGNGEAASAELEAAQQALRTAQAEVARLKEALANAAPGEQEQLRAQLAAAQGQLQQVEQRVGVAQQAVAAALTALATASEALTAAERKVDAFAATPLAAPPPEGKVTNDARLSELLAILQEIVGKANDAKLAADMKLVQEVLKAREAENLRRSQEYQEQLEKAERMKKTMGCIGKVIGWALVVVSVVMVVFDFGAVSATLAAIGLALAIGEEAGLNITGKIMDPIIKLVMKAVESMGKVIGSVLVDFGLPAEFVKKIQTVVGAVAVAAMVIGALFAAKKLGATIATKFLTKEVMKTTAEQLAKLVPQMVKDAAKQAAAASTAISKAAAKAVGSNADNMAVRVGTAAKAAQAMQLASQTSQSVGNIVIADMDLKAAKLLADLELGLADTQIFRDLIQKLLEYFVTTNKMVQDLFQLMVDAQASENETARFVTSRIARA